jgi:hypothetical protein
MITPQEAAKLVRWQDTARDKEIHNFVIVASPRELQLFIHNLAADGIPDRRVIQWTDMARAAIDVRLAEDAERTAQKLVNSTDTLVTEAKTLVKLTRRLYILTVVLAFLALFEIFKFLLGLVCPHIQ